MQIFWRTSAGVSRYSPSCGCSRIHCRTQSSGTLYRYMRKVPSSAGDDRRNRRSSSSQGDPQGKRSSESFSIIALAQASMETSTRLRLPLATSTTKREAIRRNPKPMSAKRPRRDNAMSSSPSHILRSRVSEEVSVSKRQSHVSFGPKLTVRKAYCPSCCQRGRSCPPSRRC